MVVGKNIHHGSLGGALRSHVRGIFYSYRQFKDSTCMAMVGMDSVQGFDYGRHCRLSVGFISLRLTKNVDRGLHNECTHKF